MAQCCGIKADGFQCTTFVIEGSRCLVHQRTLNNYGPNGVRHRELKFINQKNVKHIHDMFRQEHEVNPDQAKIHKDAALRREGIRYREAQLELHRIIDQETQANGGIDADEAIRIAYIRRLREANDARRRREHLLEQRAAARQQARLAEQRAAPREEEPRVYYMRQELANIANDRQNVHTELVVNKVKQTVQRILQVEVPEEYQTDTLKTTGEIILECKLSREAAWQMMAKYCQDDDIYEMGNGIYAKVLNSVWQYIKASPDAEDLKKILASEMKDNVGMCAQGNLSRLCNILSGYLDGVEVNEKSTTEILGERFAQLVEIENIDERTARARILLAELHVPDETWNDWLQAAIAF